MREALRALFFPKVIPAGEEFEACQKVREAFGALADVIEAEVPESRYQSVCITLLEQAAAMATKAFSHG